MRRSLLVAGGAIALSLLAIGVAAGANDSGDDSGWSEVADHAREQMASHAFDGVVVVEWQDENGSHGGRWKPVPPSLEFRRDRLGCSPASRRAPRGSGGPLAIPCCLWRRPACG